MNIKTFYWFAVSLIIVAVDQLSKWWIVEHFKLFQQLQIFSWLNIVHVRNYGAAFSFLDIAGGGQRWFFVLISFLVCVFLAVWLVRIPSQKPMLKLSISLIIGGALGNLWGRLLRGYVVDFIDVYWKSYHWPAFNVADSAVTIGAVLLLWQLFFKEKA